MKVNVVYFNNEMLTHIHDNDKGDIYMRYGNENIEIKYHAENIPKNTGASNEYVDYFLDTIREYLQHRIRMIHAITKEIECNYYTEYKFGYTNCGYVQRKVDDIEEFDEVNEDNILYCYNIVDISTKIDIILTLSFDLV